MRVVAERVLPAEIAEQAWQIYAEAFEEMKIRAVQRHVLYRHEFDEVMTDERVRKLLYVDHRRPDRIRGVATVTDDLSAIPLISPEYFAHHWPDLFAARQIWYVGFLAVHPAARGTGAFARLTREIWRPVLAAGGMAVVDVCRHNDELGFHRAIHHALGSLGGDVRAEHIDDQSYWIYEAPGPS
ncbi:hypothetical protein [Polymorphospora sp. NPDC050346]|uniref:hypothetical protein n=1 Tax=Polymorphospora sp. NPDC050346 TaxID=3155780 RepID=UPI0033D72D47